MKEWKRFPETRPPVAKDVIVYDPEWGVSTGFLMHTGQFWFNNRASVGGGFTLDTVEQWMEKPDAPEQPEEESNG